jgi:tRNA pseudouridine55 synthase
LRCWSKKSMTLHVGPGFSPGIPDMDGVLVVNKPVGPSSHDVVKVARRSLGFSRIGHTGTLDPRAAGVLPLVLGQATRLAQHLTATDKEYEARMRFGVVTDTYDAAGEIVDASGAVPDRAAFEAVLDRFRGTYDQTPPAYSAKMVGGTRAYALARQGKAVPSPATAVTVHALDVLEFAPPCARVRVRCSAGFYVRTLAHDVGQLLGTGAILDELLRTEAAGYRIGDAVSFEQLVTAPRADLRQLARPMESLLIAWPSAQLTSEGVEWARHGRDLGPRQVTAPLAPIPDRVRLLAPDGRLIGLADRSNLPGFLHPAVVFSYN